MEESISVHQEMFVHSSMHKQADSEIRNAWHLGLFEFRDTGTSQGKKCCTWILFHTACTGFYGITEMLLNAGAEVDKGELEQEWS